MIRLIDVYKEYDNGTKALKGVNLRIDDGEFVFLVGPSGSGKSTVIKLIGECMQPGQKPETMSSRMPFVLAYTFSMFSPSFSDRAALSRRG